MPTVDVAFGLFGDSIAVDHGYSLFTAVATLIPALHQEDRGEKHPPDDHAWSYVGIHPISGRLVGNRRLALNEKSHLVIRASSDLIGELLPLAGRELAIGADKVRVSLPTIRPLRPAARLRSRLVLIKGHEHPESFLEAVRRQLTEMDVRGQPALLLRRQASSLEGRATLAPGRDRFVRRTMRIKGVEVPGYAVEVFGLDADSSLRLQERGVGGRRHFGAGVFVPARG